MNKILVINGPNLNLLGQREPERYGYKSLEEINRELAGLAREMGLEVEFFQSNHEGELVEAVQRAGRDFQGAILNAAAYTHTSLALRDAVLAIDKPVVEVHLTNPAAREDFRHRSFLAGATVGLVAGFGPRSYELALRWFAGTDAVAMEAV
ncbi:MAG: type II 3-dehydroquinate dehydratase [Deltaproteobacteria bacterium]|nr:type II 3-dehydroquinate dehydratase [Deltaproteobacteria bacterium]